MRHKTKILPTKKEETWNQTWGRLYSSRVTEESQSITTGCNRRRRRRRFWEKAGAKKETHIGLEKSYIILVQRWRSLLRRIIVLHRQCSWERDSASQRLFPVSGRFEFLCSFFSASPRSLRRPRGWIPDLKTTSSPNSQSRKPTSVIQVSNHVRRKRFPR